MIGRREVITLLGAVTAWPLAARAQQAAMPVVGYLSGATLEMTREYVTAFHRGLADAGFAEGRNVASTDGQRVITNGCPHWLPSDASRFTLGSIFSQFPHTGRLGAVQPRTI